MEGKAIIFSAPSGAGKTTIVNKLLEKFANLKFSISATTRKPRPNESHGKDYYFLDKEDFESRINTGELLEWEEVYEGTFYGTLNKEVERIWSEGNHVVFDVDVKGGLKLKKKFGDQALAVFVKVPSIDILAERLSSRSTESEEALKIRIGKAALEMQEEKNFDQVVVNESLDQAVVEAERIVLNFLAS